MAAPGHAGELPKAPQARDVIAFGHEVGRVLSDGRVVGRAEPFAKVFPSSRTVKRVVGVTAWAILEDIALDARLDVEGRLVAGTNVRRIAHNLGLARNTVTKHLSKLREHGFVLHEEQRDDGTGKYVTSRYVLDPSACLERFTVTPSADGGEAADRPERSAFEGSEPCRNSWSTEPRRKICDTDVPVAQSTRHREVRQKNKTVVGGEDQQQTGPPQSELRERLTSLGVAPAVADELLATHPSSRVADVLDAVEVQDDVRNRAGWVVTALRRGWDVADAAERRRAGLTAQRRRAAVEARRVGAATREVERPRHAAGWATAISAVLDDNQLMTAVARLSPPVPGLDRRSAHVARGDLIAWAVAVHRSSPNRPLQEALTAALADTTDAGHAGPGGGLSGSSAGDVAAATGDDLPEPPTVDNAPPLHARLVAAVRRLEPDPEQGAPR